MSFASSFSAVSVQRVIDGLLVTASGKGQLKQQPLSRLKQYANAYNIKFNGILEKDELIDILIYSRVSTDHVQC